MIQNFKCPICGKEFEADDANQPVICPVCGKQVSPETAQAEPEPQPQPEPQQQPQAEPQPQPAPQPQQQQQQSEPKKDVEMFSNGPSGKSRGVAGLLAILLGCFGAHYFYCGKTMAGLIFLAVSILSCGTLATVACIVSIIQGVMMMTKSQDEFEKTYVTTQNSFPLF